MCLLLAPRLFVAARLRNTADLGVDLSRPREDEHDLKM